MKRRAVADPPSASTLSATLARLEMGERVDADFALSQLLTERERYARWRRSDRMMVLVVQSLRAIACVASLIALEQLQPGAHYLGGWIFFWSFLLVASIAGFVRTRGQLQTLYRQHDRLNAAIVRYAPDASPEITARALLTIWAEVPDHAWTAAETLADVLLKLGDDRIATLPALSIQSLVGIVRNQYHRHGPPSYDARFGPLPDNRLLIAALLTLVTRVATDPALARSDDLRNPVRWIANESEHDAALRNAASELAERLDPPLRLRP